MNEMNEGGAVSGRATRAEAGLGYEARNMEPNTSISIGLDVTYDIEVDGRIIADVENIRGAIAYGNTREEATRKALAIALEIIADEIENGERPISKTKIFFGGCFPS